MAALHCGQGNLDLVEHLVGLGLDVNAPDHRDGRLPIDAAASNGHAKVVHYCWTMEANWTPAARRAIRYSARSWAAQWKLFGSCLTAASTRLRQIWAQDATGFALWQGQRR
ncbi:MAG: ankyrin repeat domain-containing protein [Caulobacteraceae bacterium]|nr:ankyrin repeat domain-containing protein [Caulobacteraceae bacterium]